MNFEYMLNKIKETVKHELIFSVKISITWSNLKVMYLKNGK